MEAGKTHLKIKLDRAKLLLSQSDMAIETIAGKCSFPSFKHLATLFRCEVGVTPRAFRKTIRMSREIASDIAGEYA